MIGSVHLTQAISVPGTNVGGLGVNPVSRAVSYVNTHRPRFQIRADLPTNTPASALMAPPAHSMHEKAVCSIVEARHVASPVPPTPPREPSPNPNDPQKDEYDVSAASDLSSVWLWSNRDPNQL